MHPSISTRLAVFAVLLWGVVSATSAQQASSGQTLERVQWIDTPVPGVQNAIAVGSPAAPGLYVMLGKMTPGARFPAHKHPDARVTTVLKGTMYYASGDDLSDSKMVAYPAGSIVQTPAGVGHVMWARDGEVVMQETGVGPSGLLPVSAAPVEFQDRASRVYRAFEQQAAFDRGKPLPGKSRLKASGHAFDTSLYEPPRRTG